MFIRFTMFSKDNEQIARDFITSVSKVFPDYTFYYCHAENKTVYFSVNADMTTQELAYELRTIRNKLNKDNDWIYKNIKIITVLTNKQYYDGCFDKKG